MNEIEKLANEVTAGVGVDDDDAVSVLESLKDDESVAEEENYEFDPSANPDLWLHRERTKAIVRRYARLAIEAGRLPALLGREFFRTRVSPYHTQTFEDTVIFVHDVERCLWLLDDIELEFLAMAVMQEQARNETARMFRCTRRTVVRCHAETLDKLSAIFLEREIITRVPEKHAASVDPCQGGQLEESSAK